MNRSRTTIVTDENLAKCLLNYIRELALHSEEFVAEISIMKTGCFGSVTGLISVSDFMLEARGSPKVQSQMHQLLSFVPETQK